MTLFDWTLVALFGLGALLTVATVGKPRKVVKSSDAVCAVVVDALLILGVVL